MPEEVLDGDINVVVDFRYSVSSKLTWWFDHHVTGIMGDEERRHFSNSDRNKKFYDPHYSSCCKFIVDTAKDRFGWQDEVLDDLVYWADMIDTAGFPDAKTAVEIKDPALQLMTVIEVHGDDSFVGPRIAKLAAGTTVSELAAEKEVADLLDPLVKLHQESLEAVKARAVVKGDVVSFDISDVGTDRYNKFIPYWLFPESLYCVAVTLGETRAKVSVGSNPWSNKKRKHDIGPLCAEYGGGGHPVVGAVSLQTNEIERARRIAAEITEKLHS